eukprot:TRINITY_DN8934_c0_g2_i1.p1 TRINITY_DN8934_c0_g2~~TRINITY_DN8934_c0_g2_i1.p1  ORF type:complete len:619 (-),score=82.17 TRINITY_DN8934_c0_g2_i1:348-2204(-)
MAAGKKVGAAAAGVFGAIAVCLQGCVSVPEPPPQPTASPTLQPTPEPTPTSGTTCGAAWTQCGGKEWTGSTCCEQGLVCKVDNEWYHQCEPPSEPSPTPSPIAPSSSPTPSPTILTTVSTTRTTTRRTTTATTTTATTAESTTSQEFQYFADTTMTINRNPERGFYKHTETHATPYSRVTKAQVEGYYNDGYTLILRVFYMEPFANGELIWQSYLDSMEQDFAVCRQVGIKVIVRMAYVKYAGSAWPPPKPYGDAKDKAVVLTHLDQLKAVFESNWDVIAVVQTGLIGIWGEWHYTDAFGPEDYPSENSKQERAEIVEKYLDAIPPQRQIQLRTPLAKKDTLARMQTPGCGTSVTGYTDCATPLPAALAHTPSTKASRLAHHNDCFLASTGEYEWHTDPEANLEYLHDETTYLAMGGETCAPNEPRSNCNNAIAEMASLHFTYLNIDYHKGVLDKFEADGCMAQIKRKLGYRISLETLEMPSRYVKGDDFFVKMGFKNMGWAAPINERDVIMVLVSTTDSSQNIELSFIGNDARPQFWLPSATTEYSVSQAFSGDNIPEGEYKAYIKLSDPAPALKNRAAYSMRLANADSDLGWDATTGLHMVKSHIVTVVTQIHIVP